MFKEVGETLSGRPRRLPKTTEQKRDEFIKKRIEVKDAREDSRSRQINVSWSINAAIASFGRWKQDTARNFEDCLETRARKMLNLFDKLYEERSQEQARKYEIQDDERNQAEIDAGENAAG